MLSRTTFRSLVGWAFAVFAFFNAAAFGTTLSDNTANATNGAESATSTRYLTASFKTDASAHTLNSVMLLMSMTSTGTAALELRADAGLEPGALLTTLASPASYTTAVGPNTFTTGGYALTANTTYWLVLKPSSGTFTWAWTATNSGTGAGFTNVWGVSEDSGSFWWSDDFYALQSAVIVDACSAPSIGTPPVAVNTNCSTTVQFTVEASGTGTLSYAWSRNGVALSNVAGHISGATTSTLSITGTTRADAGSYSVTVSNICSTSTASSSPVALNICIANYNCVGGVDVQDIFDFLQAWFNGDALADINNSSSLTVQDIFDFLSAWFSGC